MEPQSLSALSEERHWGLIVPGLLVVSMLACGGGRTALDPDDGQGAKHLRSDAGAPARPEAGKADATPARGVIHLTASTDQPSAVELYWTVEGDLEATAYLIRRDDQDRSVLQAPGHAIWDTSAEPGSVSAVKTLSATQGTRTDAVALSWSAASTTPGVAHVYQVIAVNGEAKLAESEKVTGWRAAPPLLGYEFSRDDGSTWQLAGTGTSFDDTEAPLGTISAKAEATPRYPLGYVRLQVTTEPTIVPGPPSMYRVRAKTATESGAPSPRATGFRGVGRDVSFQWQRSAGDRDADYRDLDDVTGSLWFDDTLPSDQTRNYRAVMHADGASGTTAGASALVKRFKSVSVGYTHSCGIVSDGKRICWGDNGYQEAPPKLSKDSYSTVVTSWAHEVTCGIREGTAAVDCWGVYSDGDARITPPSGAFRSISIGDASGSAYLCGILTDGSVYCPTAKFTGSVQAVSAGYNFVCAILSDGSRVCSGANNLGQAPPGPSTDKFRSIGTGNTFACGLHTDDSVACWGRISLQEDDVSSPQGSFKSLSVGRNVACALDAQGKVLCVGLQNARNQWLAPPEAANATFVNVSAGNTSACGVRDDGKVVCWGENLYGSAPALPSKERFESITLTDVLESNFGTICGVRSDGIARCWGSWTRVPDDLKSQRFKNLSLGYQSVCGLREDGTVVCWSSVGIEPSPPEPSAAKFSMVVKGALNACALGTNGKITCWGENSRGQSDPPGASFTTISLGFEYGCGLTTEGKVLCWGDKQNGGTQPPDGRFTAVSAGKWQACALDGDHHAVCWGQTNAVPPPADTFKTISVAVDTTSRDQGFACGVRSDDRVICWGKNLSAETPSRPTLDRYWDVQAGTCAIRIDHHVVCWDGTFGF